VNTIFLYFDGVLSHLEAIKAAEGTDPTKDETSFASEIAKMGYYAGYPFDMLIVLGTSIRS
jgi:hypothetical protein